MEDIGILFWVKIGLFVVEKTLIFNYVHTMRVWNIILWVRSCSKHMKAK